MTEDKNMESTEFLKKTNLYKEFVAEKEEILKHKWIESQKAGFDIGYDKAFFDWEIKYYREWKKKRESDKTKELSA
ncbi:MAG: hypothetical protein JW928_09165 [Candidatus Aureabacteria bacterium]|nr:hypothetical protein [Candidatus Auribacterota bacterium]